MARLMQIIAPLIQAHAKRLPIMSTVQTPTQHIPAKITDSIKLVDEAHAKTNLLGMTQAQLADYFKSIGEKPFARPK